MFAGAVQVNLLDGTAGLLYCTKILVQLTGRLHAF